MNSTGISGPEEVPEGSTAAITVECSNVATVIVFATGTGNEFEVKVVDGKAIFEMPAGAAAGTTIEVIDKSDPDRSHSIIVGPASSPP